MSSSLESVFVYGYFGKECLEQLVPLGIAGLLLAFLLQRPFAVTLNELPTK